MSSSWQTGSAASNAAAAPASLAAARSERWATSERARALARRAPRPELVLLLALAAVLDLWALGRNGWANEYYSAAVRSMSSSWHNFLFASLDPSGVMTVDKPPLALWVQALSVRIFGYHSLSVLVPQALMGIASVALVYDLVRRRFGRIGGFVAGVALALTPMTVAISRHNNPDALLVLCCVGALWCAVRALEDGRTRWLLGAGVLVGLGFEAKMGVALAVVPGIAAAWLWVAPAGRTRLHALRQLLAGGAAMIVVGGAWPALVALTPAAQRPWVSGTNDNSIFSLIFEYNGLGRVDGQTGGPGGAGGGGMFGGGASPLRLLNASLGGQAGWLLGFALVAGAGLLVSTRLRRADPRTGWLIAVGGAFLATAVVFSAASGIFHPYYVALLAPFLAALVGAGAAEMLGGGLDARIVAPLAVLAGVATELIVRGDYPGQLSWLPAALIVVGLLAAIALFAFRDRVVRIAALGAALAALLIAPGAWAFDTLGYATSGTFPSGGPVSASSDGAPFGGRGFGRFGARPGLAQGGPQLFGAPGAGAPGAGAGASSSSAERPGGGGVASIQPAGPSAGAGAPAGGPPPGAGAGAGFGGPGGPGSGAGGLGGPFGGENASLKSVIAYVKGHGGGTLALASQSGASAAIINQNADVAGIGGFSGRESSVGVAWLAQAVRAGRVRWVLGEGSGGGFSGRLPGDTRTGSRAAMTAVAKVCARITIAGVGTTSDTPSGTASGPSSASGSRSATRTKASTSTTLYDCRGDAAALQSAAARQSSS